MTGVRGDSPSAMIYILHNKATVEQLTNMLKEHENMVKMVFDNGFFWAAEWWIQVRFQKGDERLAHYYGRILGHTDCADSLTLPTPNDKLRLSKSNSLLKGGTKKWNPSCYPRHMYWARLQQVNCNHGLTRIDWPITAEASRPAVFLSPQVVIPVVFDLIR